MRTDRVYVALRRAGHGFGKPRRLATGRIRGVAAAIGERGDVLVAWDARGVAAHALQAARPPRLPRDRHDPLQARLLRRHAPRGHAERARRAGVERPVPSEGGDARPGAASRPPTRAAGRAPVRRARGCSRRSRRAPTTGSAARSTPSPTAPGVVAIAWRGAGRRARARAAAAPAADALGAGHHRGALRPRGRPGRAPRRGLGRRRRGPARASCAPRSRTGVGAPFGPPEDVSAAGRDARFGHAGVLRRAGPSWCSPSRAARRRRLASRRPTSGRPRRRRRSPGTRSRSRRPRSRATCTGARRTRSGSRAPSGRRTASARSRPRRRVWRLDSP